MEQNLEKVFERTDDIIETVQQQPPPARPSSGREKSLQEKLYDIYVEECEKEPVLEGLRSNVNLLEKLMKREPLPCLVVNLYPENQGYSLMLKDKDGVLIETLPVTYVGQKLLEYLDAEELPSFLIDVLEKSPVNVFHRGCVIAEIRDYRQSSDTCPPGEPGAEPTVSSPAYQTRYILLRPTMQSLVSDIESISSDNNQWTQEEKLELESQLLLATAEPLCLDPSVAVTCTTNRLLFNDQLMTDPMRQCFTSHDWPYQQLQEKQYVCTTPPDVQTMIACRKRAEMKADSQYDLKIAEAGKYVDTWKQRPCELVAPSEVDVQKYARGKQSMPHDDSESTSWPDPEVKYDYLFDFEEGNNQSCDTKPSITQSISDPFFSLEMEPPTEGKHDSQTYLPQVAPSDCLLGSIAGEQIESAKAVGVCQGSVQSKAECAGKKQQECADPVCLSQPSPGKKAKSHSLGSPVLEMKVKTPASLLTLPSTSGQGSSALTPPSVPVRGRKLPRLAPSLKSASLPQQTFWGVSSTNPLPSSVQPSVSSSESCPPTQGPSSGTAQNVINLFGLPQGVSLLKSSPSQVQSFPTSAPALTETSSRGFLPPPRGQMPSTQTRTPQHSVQTPMQFIVKNTPGPVTVALPPGSVILHPESQTQQLQSWFQPQPPQQQPQPQSRLYSQPEVRQLQPWLQPQQPQQQPQPQPQPRLYLQPELRQLQPCLQPQQSQQLPHAQVYSQPKVQQSQHPEPLYLLIPKQHQPPRAPVPTQPVPPSYQGTQRSSFQQWAMSTQRSGLFNLAEAGRVCQPQATMVCQVGSTQRPGQSLPSQSFQHPADQGEQLQAQSQTVQLRLMPRIVVVPRAPTQHSGHQGHTEDQYRGTGKGGPPTTPKS